ncbi:hypothetical protein GCM10022423_29560 [Flavobacterium ginsengiterrae]|uniref:Peptidase C14 caspase domain-containing protein n=2 Tax=Flavobacteriaceae TaxID=49546 RepID=A0ABP7GTT8_9FLAO
MAYQAKYNVSFSDYATSGVAKDLERMKRIALRNGHIFEKITNEDATVENIKKKISEIGGIIKEGDTFVFYFSGHGAELPDQNGDEESKFDQVLAAYDDYLVDDEVYKLLNRYFQKTKNIMIVDACHSSSSYKINKSFLDFKIDKNKRLRFQNEIIADRQLEKQNSLICDFGNIEDINEDFNLIYIGAAEDSAEASGGSNGGLLTINLESIIINAMAVGNWNSYTYPRLACELRTRISLMQNVQYHEIGKSVNKYANTIPFKTL